MGRMVLDVEEIVSEVIHFQMNAALKHYLNPLHIYCRLRDMGIGKETAHFLCCFYERSIFKHFISERDK